MKHVITDEKVVEGFWGTGQWVTTEQTVVDQDAEGNTSESHTIETKFHRYEDK